MAAGGGGASGNKNKRKKAPSSSATSAAAATASSPTTRRGGATAASASVASSAKKKATKKTKSSIETEKNDDQNNVSFLKELLQIGTNGDEQDAASICAALQSCLEAKATSTSASTSTSENTSALEATALVQFLECVCDTTNGDGTGGTFGASSPAAASSTANASSLLQKKSLSLADLQIARVWLVTHVLQRLVVSHHDIDSQHNIDDTSWKIMAAFALKAAQLLTSMAGGVKLEKAVQGAARHWMGRTLLAVTTAATAVAATSSASADNTATDAAVALSSWSATTSALLALDKVLTWQLGASLTLGLDNNSSSNATTTTSTTTSSSSNNIDKDDLAGRNRYWKHTSKVLEAAVLDESIKILLSLEQPEEDEEEEQAIRLLDWSKERAVWELLAKAQETIGHPGTTSITATSTAAAAAEEVEDDSKPTTMTPSKRSGLRGAHSKARRARKTTTMTTIITFCTTSDVVGLDDDTTAATLVVVDAALQEELLQALCACASQLEHQYSLKMDARMACRRWSSVALVWLLHGHEHIVGMLQKLLLLVAAMKENEVEDEQSNHDTAQVVLTHGVVAIPMPFRRVATVALVSRMVRVLLEAGNACGNRAPVTVSSGGSLGAGFGGGGGGGGGVGVEAIVRSLVSPPTTSSSSSGDKNKKKLKPQPRADVRPQALVLLNQLVLAHFECLDCSSGSSSSGSGVTTTTTAAAETTMVVVNAPHDPAAANDCLLLAGYQQHQTSFYPFVKHALVELARSASSSVVGSSYSEQLQSTNRLQAAAAARVLQLLQLGNHRVVDAPLVEWVVSRLVKCLEDSSEESDSSYLHRSSSGTGNNSGNPDWMGSLQLDAPLPILVPPALLAAAAPVKKKRRKAASLSSPSAVDNAVFAGFFPAKEQAISAKHEEAALLVRAMHHNNNDANDDTKNDSNVETPSKKKKKKASSKTITTAAASDTSADEIAAAEAKLLSLLVDIAKACYSNNSTVSAATAAAAAQTEDITATTTTAGRTGTKKRKAASTAAAATTTSTTRRRKKRKKQEAVEAEQEEEEEKQAVAAAATRNEAASAMTTTTNSRHNNIMSAICASLATTVFRALEMCFNRRRVDWMCRRLHATVTGDHLLQILDLGLSVEQFVEKLRATPPLAELALEKKNDSKQNDGPRTSTTSFSTVEQQLWSAYTDLCICIGRGQLSNRSERSEIIGKYRLVVYQKIARCRCGMHMSNQPDESSSVSPSWPLWLSVPHRRLIAANLVSESIIAEAASTAPDRFLVDGFIAGISDAISDFELLLRGCSRDPTSRMLEEGIPLSLNNARLFAAAVLRLPKKERVAYVSSLLSAVHSGLTGIKSDDSKLDRMRQNDECSGFVARAVSLCTSLAIAVTCSDALAKKLVDIVRISQPSYLPSSPPEIQTLQAERCFVSLFDHAGASDFLESDLSSSSMDKETSKTLQSILELAFSMAFAAAPADRCYLLFASWNALGKSGLWIQNETGVTPYDGLPDDLSGLVLQLRNEMCYVSRLMRQVNRVSTVPGLNQVIQLKDHANRVAARKTLIANVKQELRSMLVKASDLCDDLLSRFVPEDAAMEQDIPSQVHALLEALTVYLSFAVASHTNPDSDFYTILRTSLTNSRTQKQSRGYSSDSETYHSEAESTDSRDVTLDAADRLENVCSVFGAVPAYPDWLDSDCQLWETVTPQDATVVAVLALETLTKLASVSSEQANMAQYKSLSSTKGIENSRLASNLCRLQHLNPRVYSGDESTEDETSAGRDLGSDISDVCGIDKDIINLWMGGCSRRSRHLARHNWIRSSSQRILGSLQDIIREQLSDLDYPELRAAGEWECLLGWALTSSELEFTPDERSSSQDLDYDVLIRSERWRGVHKSVLNALPPAAALLHFSLNQAGRKSHPLKSIDFSLDDCFDSFSLSESLVLDNPAPQSVKHAAAKTLSLLAFYTDGDEELLTGDAIAANIVADSTSFNLLRGVASTRFAFSTLSDLQDAARLTVHEMGGAFGGLFEALGLILVDDTRLEETAGYDLSCLRVSVGAQDEKFATTAFGEMGLREALFPLISPSTFILSSSDAFLPVLVSCIWPDCSNITHATRLVFLRTLCVLAADENQSTKISENPHYIVNHISAAFNEVTANKMTALVERYICGELQMDEVDTGDASSERPLACSLLANVLSADGNSSFSSSELILDLLFQSYMQWSRFPLDVRVPVLNLYFLLACRCTKLLAVGSKLVEDLKSNPTDNDAADVKLENLASFFAFIRQLRLASANTSSTCTDVSSDKNTKSELPTMCSHAVKTGFQDQHWYHCYTCGLTGDKGCCTLCALLCHKARGHDVSFSRFSAFFCDCGAESGAAGATRRHSCKCLSAVSSDDVAKAFAQGRGNVIQPGHTKSERLLSALTCAAIAQSSFPDNVGKSINSLIKQGSVSNWRTSLFELVKDRFQVYQTTTEGLSMPAQIASEAASYDSLQRSLLKRKPSAAVGSGSDSLIPVVNFKPGSFRVKMSDSAVDSLKRLMLSPNGASRFAAEADSRARLMVAESNSLLFCTIIPTLNTITLDDDSRCSSQSRASVGILGNETFGFNIVGIRLSKSNEAHLLVWGTHEAAVCVLNEARNGCDRIVELELGLGSSESSGSDFLGKCEWLPGSSTSVYAVCLRSILFFDLVTTGKSVSPASAVKVGSDVSFRGVVATELKEKVSTRRKSWKVFSLMEDGHLHAFGLQTDGGKLRVMNLNLEPKHSIKLPVNGVSVDDGTAPPFSLTLGEGIQLSYLEQSRLLLYQAVAESVLALQIDSNGTITASFTLLPKTISKELLGSQGEVRPVTGPYSNWTELGAIQHGSSTFFRVSCLGRRSGKEATLLCVDFNEAETRVRELPWDQSEPTSSSGPSLAGLVVFSAPFSFDEPRSRDLPSFKERLFLAALLSNGSLHVFGEENGTRVVATPESQNHSSSWLPPGSRNSRGSLSEHPLLEFEELSETDADVTFHGVGLGSPDDIRKKLHRDSGSLLISPSVDGFTLFVRVKCKSIFFDCKSKPKTIVAFRILVGSSSFNAIPKRLSIVGRELELLPGTKKWYSFHLNAQEIALSMRNGFVSIGVSSSHSIESNPIIDSIECYTIQQAELEHWIPTALPSIVASGSKELANGGDSESVSTQHRFLQLSLESFASFCELQHTPTPTSPPDWEVLQQLIQATALDEHLKMNDAISSILASFEADEDSRESFRDKAVLLGCSAFLSKCQQVLGSSFEAHMLKVVLLLVDPETRRFELLKLDFDSLNARVSDMLAQIPISVTEESLRKQTYTGVCGREGVEMTPEKLLSSFCAGNCILVAIPTSVPAKECVRLARPILGDEKVVSMLLASGLDAKSWSTKKMNLRPSLVACFRTLTQVAKYRPLNYLQSIEEGSLSPGVKASKFMTECFARSSSNMELVSQFAELCLVEMAVATRSGTESKSCSRIGSFEGLRYMLLSENESVVSLSCAAISRFCRKYESPSPSEDADCDLFAAQEMVAYYRCDSCELFPIKDIRFALLDDTHPFDLCQACYGTAKQYASRMKYSEKHAVSVNGEAVGGDIKLSCAEVKLMQPVRIRSDDSRDAKGEASEAPEDKQMLLPDSTGTVVLRQQLFDDFMDRLFSEIICFLVEELKQHRRLVVKSLVQLAIAIVHHSGKGGRRLERAKRLGKELVLGLSRLVIGEPSIDGDRTQLGSDITLLLRNIARLVVRDEGALVCLDGSEPGINDPLDGAASPETPKCCHGITATRRKHTRGADKGRRFYACAKDSKSRCNFFLWEDEVRSQGEHVLLHFDEDMAKSLWEYMESPLERNPSTTVQGRLCEYITTQVSSLIRMHPGANNRNNLPFLDGVELEDSLRDLVDGVFVCRGKLQDIAAKELVSPLSLRSRASLLHGSSAAQDNATLTVEATFSLIALVGGPGGEATSYWAPLLCEVILSSKDSVALQLAKRALLQLCGTKKGVYSSTRAHYTFGFHREKLVSALAGTLKAGLVVREKARQCGHHWRTKEPLQLENLRAGDLLGTEDLVSEDIVTVSCLENARQTIHDLSAVAKKRTAHWRRFCGLQRVPKSQTLTSDMGKNEILKLPPVVLLFAVACSLRGDSQVKALKLLDLALTLPSKKKQLVQPPAILATDEDEVDDVETCVAASTPQDVLSLTVDDAFSFVTRFGCCGSSTELRALACTIASKICAQSDPSMAGQLFDRLVRFPLGETSEMGKCHCELLTLLQGLVLRAGTERIDFQNAAARIQSYWKIQMHAIRYDRSNQAYIYFETRSAAGRSQKKRFELSPCVFCQQAQSSRKEKGKAPSRAHGESSRASRQGTETSGSANSRPWLPEQVTAYSRGRLEGWQDSSTSDEFNSYASFKYRLVLSEVHLEVNDPRGRFVKEITIYVAPRPVADVAQLKSPAYSDKWQQCGTITLAQGAGRGSCKLDKPFVAANIRLEYTDFYERPGSSKAAEGSFIVHCPRCTRVVSNAHGVCGNCGEVAFQCRKCRHINYDRLDAFLCVECGYCASGGFVFELTAAIASNAISISNDHDYERSCGMFSVASRLYDDLLSTLRETLCILLNKADGSESESASLKRAFNGGLPSDPSASNDQTSIALSKLGKQGSVVKAVARPDSRVLSGSRAQSLMRLTREWRESANSSEASRRSGDVIIHHLGRDIQVEDEDSAELFGLLEGSALRSGDDSLSRLIASVQNRRERRAAIAAAAAAGGDDQANSGGTTGSAGNANQATAHLSSTTSGKTKHQLTKESLDICDRLYTLTREAEREAHLLKQRIAAWRRLETDSLGQPSPQQQQQHQQGAGSSVLMMVGEEHQGALDTSSLSAFTFEPSHCSVCSSPVALQLLTLWLCLLEAEPDKVIVTRDMIHLLLSEETSIVHKSLQEMKRRVLKAIALKSKDGSVLVLEALRARLHAIESVPCAEILGSIVEEGGPSMFMDLAMEVLETSTAMDLS